jgi:hypothetical protein
MAVAGRPVSGSLGVYDNPLRITRMKIAVKHRIRLGIVVAVTTPRKLDA